MADATKNFYFIKNRQKERISAIIPCAGMSTRLRMKSSKCINELRKGYTLLDKSIETLKSCYSDIDIVVVAGQDIDKYRKIVRKNNVRLVYNHLFESTNVAYSLGLGLDAINTDSCIVVMGDLYYNTNCILNIDVNQTTKILYVPEFDKYEVGFSVDEKNRVCQFHYSSNNKWGQICYLHSNELDIVRKLCYNTEHSKYFCYEIFNKAIDNGAKFSVFRSNNSYVYDIDTLETLYKVIEHDNKLNKVK